MSEECWIQPSAFSQLLIPLAATVRHSLLHARPETSRGYAILDCFRTGTGGPTTDLIDGSFRFVVSPLEPPVFQALYLRMRSLSYKSVGSE